MGEIDVAPSCHGSVNPQQLSLSASPRQHVHGMTRLRECMSSIGPRYVYPDCAICGAQKCCCRSCLSFGSTPATQAACHSTHVHLRVAGANYNESKPQVELQRPTTPTQWDTTVAQPPGGYRRQAALVRGHRVACICSSSCAWLLVLHHASV